MTSAPKQNLVTIRIPDGCAPVPLAATFHRNARRTGKPHPFVRGEGGQIELFRLIGNFAEIGAKILVTDSALVGRQSQLFTTTAVS